MNRRPIQRLFKGIRFYSYYTVPKRGEKCEETCDTKEESEKEGCFIISRKTKPITHVIIDLDGVILDAIRYNICSHEDYLIRWRKNLKKQTKYCIMSMRNQDVGKILTEEFDLPFNEKVYAHGVWQIQRELYPKANLVRGAADLLSYFTQHRIPLALISSSNTKGFNILYNILKKKGMEGCFCHYVHGDDVKEGKPHPEMLLKAARKFYSGPTDFSKYLVIDSGVCGAVAARAAGMQSVLFTDQCVPREMVGVADVTLFDLNDFNPDDFNLLQN